MTHPRQLIRKALVAQLELALPSVVVTDQNPRQMKTPSVQVVHQAEAAADPGLQTAPRRLTSFGFVCRAKGEQVQDDLDELADAVERTVAGQLETDNIRGWLSYASSEQVLDSQQDDRIGALTVTFDCEWSR